MARTIDLPREVNPTAVLGHIDAPGEGAIEAAGTLRVTGWCCAASGVASVDVYVDGAFQAQASPTLPRFDIGALYPAIEGSGASGFSVDVPLDGAGPGAVEVAIVAEDFDGNRRVLKRTVRRVSSAALYREYHRRTSPTAEDIKNLRGRLANPAHRPEIHLWVEADTAGDLAATLRSIRDQDYPSWHCTIVPGPMAGNGAADALGLLSEGFDRDRFQVTEAIPSLADLEPLSVSFHGFLKAGEVLAEHALLFLALEGASTGADVVYSDRDIVDMDGRNSEPWFNPDWSPDYLLSRNYVGGFFLVRDAPHMRGLIDRTWLSGPAWRYSLLLSLRESARTVTHVPRVLWSEPATAPEPDHGATEELEAARSLLEQRDGQARVVPTDVPGVRRVRWRLSGTPRVSIIVPTAGKLHLLRPFVESLRTRTIYPHYELVFLDNSRGDHPESIDYLRSLGLRVLERNEPYNWSKLNNDGVRESDGELLLFMNDDMEIVDGAWLGELASLAMRDGTGAVGPMLLYPDGRIQHAGVVLVGHGGGAMHLLAGLHPADPIYRDLHRVTREVTANTGACLMVRRSIYEEVGGFDESLPIVFNDVDLCLRLADAGYRNIWTPNTVVIHHENVSRTHYPIGADEERFRARWGERLQAGDPHYSPHLSQLRPDCAIAWERVA
jgi:GT2 family glycosyltransferase